MTTDTDAHLYIHTQTHRGGTYPQTQTSTIPLLSILFDVRSSFLVSLNVYILLSLSHQWTLMHVPFSREGHVRPSKCSHSDQWTKELPAGNSFLTDVGTPRAHDPPRSTCPIDRHDTEETIALLDRELSRSLPTASREHVSSVSLLNR